jgi:hypothetical protein
MIVRRGVSGGRLAASGSGERLDALFSSSSSRALDGAGSTSPRSPVTSPRDVIESSGSYLSQSLGLDMSREGTSEGGSMRMGEALRYFPAHAQLRPGGVSTPRVRAFPSLAGVSEANASAPAALGAPGSADRGGAPVQCARSASDATAESVRVRGRSSRGSVYDHSNHSSGSSSEATPPPFESTFLAAFERESRARASSQFNREPRSASGSVGSEGAGAGTIAPRAPAALAPGRPSTLRPRGSSRSSSSMVRSRSSGSVGERGGERGSVAAVAPAPARAASAAGEASPLGIPRSGLALHGRSIESVDSYEGTLFALGMKARARGSASSLFSAASSHSSNGSSVAAGDARAVVGARSRAPAAQSRGSSGSLAERAAQRSDARRRASASSPPPPPPRAVRREPQPQLGLRRGAGSSERQLSDGRGGSGGGLGLRRSPAACRAPNAALSDLETSLTPCQMRRIKTSELLFSLEL